MSEGHGGSCQPAESFQGDPVSLGSQVIFNKVSVLILEEGLGV